MREISEKECGVLKGVTYRALKQAGGGGNVQHSTRVSEATLSKYHSSDPRNAESFVPLDVAIDIDRLSEFPILLETYADLLGYRIVAKDAGEAAENAESLDDLVHGLMGLFNEVGDVSRTITNAVADRVLDAGERAEIARVIEKMKKHANRVLKLSARAK